MENFVQEGIERGGKFSKFNVEREYILLVYVKKCNTEINYGVTDSSKKIIYRR